MCNLLILNKSFLTFCFSVSKGKTSRQMNLSPVLITALCQLCLGFVLYDGDSRHSKFTIPHRDTNPRVNTAPHLLRKKRSFRWNHRPIKWEYDKRLDNAPYAESNGRRKMFLQLLPFSVNDNIRSYSDSKKHSDKIKKEFSFKLSNFYNNDAFVRRNFARPSFIPFYFSPPMLLRKNYHDHGHIYSGMSENIESNVNKEVPTKPLSEKSFGHINSLLNPAESENSFLETDNLVSDGIKNLNADTFRDGSDFIADNFHLKNKIADESSSYQTTEPSKQMNALKHQTKPAMTAGTESDQLDIDLVHPEKLELKRPRNFAIETKVKTESKLGQTLDKLGQKSPIKTSMSTQALGFHRDTSAKTDIPGLSSFDQFGFHTGTKNDRSKFGKFTDFDSLWNEPRVTGFHNTNNPSKDNDFMFQHLEKPMGMPSKDSFGSFLNLPQLQKNIKDRTSDSGKGPFEFEANLNDNLMDPNKQFFSSVIKPTSMMGKSNSSARQFSSDDQFVGFGQPASYTNQFDPYLIQALNNPDKDNLQTDTSNQRYTGTDGTFHEETNEGFFVDNAVSFLLYSFNKARTYIFI